MSQHDDRKFVRIIAAFGGITVLASVIAVYLAVSLNSDVRTIKEKVREPVLTVVVKEGKNERRIKVRRGDTIVVHGKKLRVRKHGSVVRLVPEGQRPRQSPKARVQPRRVSPQRLHSRPKAQAPAPKSSPAPAPNKPQRPAQKPLIIVPEVKTPQVTTPEVPVPRPRVCLNLPADPLC